ncbi:HotDog domain-containing protein [Aspergillus falconensis]
MSSEDPAAGATLNLPPRPLTDFEQHVYKIVRRMSRTTDGEDLWSIDTASLDLAFHSASLTPQPSITYELTIAPKHCNHLGNLHGGCAATLFDVLSSMILLGVSRPGFFELGGVSRHLNVTYLRPVPVGTRVRLVSKVVNVGKRLALMRSEILRMHEDGREEVCVVSDHEKANTDPEVKM